MKKLILIIILVLTLESVCYSQELQDAAAFLRIGIGAKAQALGGSFVAICDDATAAYYNPAGLVNINRISIASMYTDLTIDRKYNFLNYVHPLDFGVIASSWINSSISGIEIRSETNQRLGSTSMKDNAYILSYARKLNNNLSFGVNYKHITHDVHEAAAKGNSFDLGLFYKTRYGLNLGLSIQDISGKVKWDNTETNKEDRIPRSIKLGASYRLLQDRVLIALDYENRKDASTTIHTGAEYLINPQIALRVGYDDKEPTFGIGLNLPNFSIDYAYKGTELGDTSKISIVYQLGRERVKKVVERPSPPPSVAADVDVAAAVTQDITPVKEKEVEPEEKKVEEMEKPKVVIEKEEIEPVEEIKPDKEKIEKEVVEKPEEKEKEKEKEKEIVEKPVKEKKVEKPEEEAAAEERKMPIKKLHRIKALIGSKEVILDKKKIILYLPVEIKKGVTFVVLKSELFTNIGIKYKDYGTKDCSINYVLSKDKNEIKLVLRDNKVKTIHNGEEILLEPAPYVKNVRNNYFIMLPLGKIYELLGIGVKWE